ncbi:MAG: DUF6305 family protein [Gemmatimonadota bacterium]
MTNRSALGTLAMLAVFLLSGAPAPLQGQGFQGPLLITSAGQSPDVQLATVLARRAGIEHTLSPLAAPGELASFKTLAIVVGASLKGLGAAGIDTNKEKERVRSLLAEAARRNIPVLLLHLGGEQRRGELTDEMITEYLPSAQWALIVKSGNQDGLFTSICGEKKIPLHELERTADGTEVLKAAFQGAG